jgi:hypothetical protein
MADHFMVGAEEMAVFLKSRAERGIPILTRSHKEYCFLIITSYRRAESELSDPEPI